MTVAAPVDPIEARLRPSVTARAARIILRSMPRPPANSPPANKRIDREETRETSKAVIASGATQSSGRDLSRLFAPAARPGLLGFDLWIASRS